MNLKSFHVPYTICSLFRMRLEKYKVYVLGLKKFPFSESNPSRNEVFPHLLFSRIVVGRRLMFSLLTSI